MFSWYDPIAKAGAYHHIDFQIMKRRACIWSWIAKDGKVISRYQALNLPLDSYDMSDFKVGPIAVKTIRPLAAYAISVRHPEQGTSNCAMEELEFEAFTPPLYLTMTEDLQHDTSLDDVGPSRYQEDCTGHYETFGRVRGTITDHTGDSVDVSAYAFQDHSWGPRDYASLTAAHRWIYAVFGDDLFADIYTIVTDAVEPSVSDETAGVHHPGDHHYGYVYDRGSFQRIQKLEVDVNVAHDGHTPKSCNVCAWTISGRGYEFSGALHAASVSTQDGGFFSTDSVGVFRSGGRVGSGLLGLRNRHRPSAIQREHLARFDPKGLIGF